MYRTGSSFWTNETQHGIQKVPACGRRQGYNGLCFFAIAFNIKKMCTKLLKAGKRRSAHTIFIFIRPRVTQNTTNIKPYYLITEKIVA